MVLSLLLAVAVVLLLAAFLWLLRRQTPDLAAQPASLMQQQIEALRTQVADSLSQNASLLQKQLESVSRNVGASSGEINQRLDHAAKLYGELRSQLGQLSQANAQIQAMVKALRQWLESHELLAIIAAVLGTITLLSVMLVVGGYLIVTR